MKRLLLASAIIFGGLAALAGQNGPGIPGFVTVPEPENHAVTVNRLMVYHDSGEYENGIRLVVNSARDFLRERTANGKAKEEKLAAVFDIDETSLSGWDLMSSCGFCSYATQRQLNLNPVGAAIPETLELFNYAKNRGVAVFFITGRQEDQRDFTAKNLHDVGYSGWNDLIMQADGNTKPAHVVKPIDRAEIEKQGYHIVLNIGDQASDLAGCCAERVFKLPNPFYLVQ
jgi:predicted secreted acid phosphatase